MKKHKITAIACAIAVAFTMGTCIPAFAATGNAKGPITVKCISGQEGEEVKKDETVTRSDSPKYSQTPERLAKSATIDKKTSTAASKKVKIGKKNYTFKVIKTVPSHSQTNESYKVSKKVTNDQGEIVRYENTLRKTSKNKAGTTMKTAVPSIKGYKLVSGKKTVSRNTSNTTKTKAQPKDLLWRGYEKVNDSIVAGVNVKKEKKKVTVTYTITSTNIASSEFLTKSNTIKIGKNTEKVVVKQTLVYKKK